LLTGAALLNGGAARTIACATGSHFATAERQFRGPLELGQQKQPYSQRTVTGAGCSVLSLSGDGPKITKGIIGLIADYGVTDIANMGAVMAPAAADTIKTFLEETQTLPDDYDMIFTGDLGKLGGDILRQLLFEEGVELGAKYSDCGAMIYSGGQKPSQGGSGCGCSAITLNSYILDKIIFGEFKKVLFCATGALMSLTSHQQGETIPGIAHAVLIEA
jgi:stage V sporulation protein AD